MENRTTLKILGVACLLIGIVWYVFTEVTKLKQAEIIRLQIATDIEKAKNAADDHEKIVKQERERSHQVEQQLEREKRLRADTEQQLDNERRQQEEDRARHQKLERQLEVVRVKAIEDENKLQEERQRLTRSMEQARAEKRVKLIVAQIRNSSPAADRPRVEKYASQYDAGNRPSGSASGAVSSGLPVGSGIEEISAYVCRKAADTQKRVVYRNTDANVQVVADPVSWGRSCVQVQLTIWKNGYLQSRKTVMFGRLYSAR